jgi:prevent-host-death family protein
LTFAIYDHNFVVMEKYPPLTGSPRKAGTEVGSAEFKTRCLELVDHVKESHAEYVVTRHGRPVARLVPVDTAEPVAAFGCMQGTVLHFDRPLEPVPAVWTPDLPDGTTD